LKGTFSTELVSTDHWTESQVVDLLQEVLSILEFVHSQGVIHRYQAEQSHPPQARQAAGLGAVKLQTQPVTAQGQPTASIAIGPYMPTEQGQGSKPRPNSDIYALGIIGIQALTKMSPMQLQTRRPLMGELIWQHLVPVSPGLATVHNDGALPLQRPLPVSKETPKRCSKCSLVHPCAVSKTQQDTTVESSNPYTAATNSDIWTEQRLNFSGQPSSHPSKFNEWSGFGASSSHQWSL